MPPWRPMLASLEGAPLHAPEFAYEPKYDGIRVIAEITPAARAGGVRLFSRQGNDKTAQFPEIARALSDFGRRIKAGVVLDGELVALDAEGEPAGFQALQGRIHLSRADDIGRASRGTPVAFIAFDILADGASDLRGLPLSARRARLERVFGNTGSPLLRLSDFVAADGRALYERALERGWEGLVAKHLDSRYQSGRRSPDWRKLKITREQEFVVGGWTEPRGTRTALGALLLGVYQGRDLVYVGHTGTGFTGAELERVWARLKALETPRSPFRARPQTNERPHWAQPELVAQVRFTEWTADGKLRHPVYLGLRDDKKPREVVAEKEGRGARGEGRGSRLPAARSGGSGRSPKAGRRTSRAAERRSSIAESRSLLIDQLDALRESGRDGVVTLPGGIRLEISNLGKVFWPSTGHTKGDLLRYYAQVAPVILPVVEDRPLVMKRFPNGVRGKAFYQQRAPEQVPEGIRVETLPDDTEVPSRIIGGSLAALVYMAQLAAISQDPWFSRTSSLHCPDFVVLDLDPMPGVTFEQVLDVARWVHEELDRLGVPGFPKTSGADGLHVYVPLEPDTPYDIAVLFCEILATLVAHRHPAEATIVRSVHNRGRRIYVDYLQNVRGKTLACAYSARASEFAGVSTPLTWKEVDRGVEREAFTIDTVPARVEKVGDLWQGLRTSKGVNLREIVGRRR